ncbi:hypothetical protein M408DRAFT_182889 [Serendipita vermifera MAFF 305830]|uniref:Uncharacterized protein n=1 Tax=Serendipita vermifera MAFF 305830 TaxID=933852 RepID=A0A0C2VZH4_SERVB|nr:hypothetical protein M408DRAFT_182889 [Serendipita vermifera MAFF 305830]
MRADFSSPPILMELEEIVVWSPLPLHPSLAGNPRLSVRLTVNEIVHEKTPYASESLQSGVWRMNGGLKM